MDKLLRRLVPVGLSGNSLYDARVVDKVYRILTEVPERLRISYRAVYRWAQASESTTYESGCELRVGR
jgi:hypothetical protein